MRSVMLKAAKIIAGILLAVQVVATGALLVTNAMGMRIIYITGGSMEPTYNIGDAVLLDTSGRSPRVGENVTFNSTNGVLTTHRVVSIHDIGGKPYLQTKGDANKTPDNDLVAVERIKGMPGFHAPLAGYALAWIASPLGRLATLGPALLWFLVMEALTIRDHMKKTVAEDRDADLYAAVTRKDKRLLRRMNPFGSPSEPTPHRGTA